MSERYLISGVQLGMFLKLPEEKRLSLIADITEKQFLGHSGDLVERDAKRLSQMIGLFLK